MEIDGQCHCGRISFVATIDPQLVSVCHCTDCQTFSSSAFRISVRTNRANVRITGTPKAYAKTADSGAVRLQHFCPECGTPVFNSGPDPEAGDWVIRWGSIRQRRQLSPTRQIWCQSVLPWLGDFDHLPGSPTGWDRTAP
ncbi:MULTISPECIES: GFA family protein [Rhodopseudomonas]|uniref:Aldehyde-activating protein n=1 Tax=Rhodopseudomonas palustris TaxID=1076 RepID=A0A0D7ES95_RHOPL|nr:MULTISPECIES: GFA family protein [Rhodopseudomonas]KIZ43430.1 aldehyde-activating protein [Rhodopseudomonas palustris]MDF3812672.1 GFA family protein [Rhodopseudomonas sp. BAL398]WOK18936.1 GFA family protein [Rhodopseudomonas sp. BAL398]